MLVFAVLCSVCFSSQATESVAVVYAENVTASAGETVSIPVAITGNSGLMGFSILLSFDDSVFTPVSVTAGDILGDGMLDDSIGYLEADTVKVSYTGTSAAYGDGTLFTVDFEIFDEAIGEYQIALSYIQDDTFDENIVEKELDCENISVKIENSYIENAVKFHGGTVDATAGQDVIVPVTVENAEEMKSFALDVSYDSKVFTFSGVESGEIISDGNISATVKSTNTISLEWNGSPVTQNGCLMYLTFSIADYIEDLKEIEFSCVDVTFSDGNSKDCICYNSAVNVNNSLANEPAIIYTDEKAVISKGYADIPVYIKNNHGIMGFGISVSYDNNVLGPVSVTKGTLLSDGNFDNNIGYSTDNIKINWNNTEDISGNGLLFVLRFKVLSKETLTGIPVEFSYSQVNTFNELWEDVELKIDIPSVPVLYGYTAKFVADGVIISVQSFTSETEALDEPEIPLKAGYIARWDYYKLGKSDLVINAKYDLPSALMLSKCTLKVDDTTRLLTSCNFEPEEKVWSSSITSVAVVDKHGKVTAVGEGECNVKVICYGKDALGNEIKASASTKIVVNEKHETKDIKQKFREAFDEFFELKIYDLLENFKKFMSVLLGHVY